ncbi:MAG TPA: ABC transporter ATP-binding protein [Stellaceae bacterium]|nr:ABC transporter ATP-binding protein [Stellaceae bacterium]
MSQKPEVLRVEGLSVAIDTPGGTLRAVSDVDLHVRRGETLGIVGESGCGKTITSLGIMGLLPRRARLSARRLELDGRDLAKLSAKERAALRGDRMAMIFQDPMTSLNPVYTIGNQMEEIYVRHGKGNQKQARERAEYLLQKVGISAAASRLAQYPHQLSGGLRQRAMVAMTLMCDPTLIIADEPTTALDVTIQAQILHLLDDLQREYHMALILITHDLGVVARMADRVVVMYAGQVVETGTAEEIFAAPRHPYTRGLLDCIPIPGKTQPGAPLGSIPGIVPSLLGPIDSCQFRNRCPQAFADCAKAPVPLRETAPGRADRCLLPLGSPAQPRRASEALGAAE